MSDKAIEEKSRCWYTVWPENGPPQSFGPVEMKATFYPYPDDDSFEQDDEEDEPSRKSG